MQAQLQCTGMYKLAPSILSADFANLLSDVLKVEEGGADILHIDVMDGHFVPNISFGAPVMKSLNGKTALPYDVHLMIEHPGKYFKDFVTPQTEYITIHEECSDDTTAVIREIKSAGVKAGVSVKPGTDLAVIENMLVELDLVLVMSVEPGFGGQKFMPEQLDKVRRLAQLKREKGYSYVIEIDGGINTGNIQEVLDAGCEMVVAGSAVFGADDIVKRVQEFKQF